MKNSKFNISLLAFLFVAGSLFAQSDQQKTARSFTDAKEYAKAADAYKQLYRQNPVDLDIYKEYLDVLIVSKEFKAALNLVEEQKIIRQQNPLPFIDMGRVYAADGKQKKADEQFDMAVQLVNGDDILTQQMANTFSAMGRDDYALKTYERVRDLTHNNYTYSGPLARLYAKKGDMDKAITSLLDAGMPFMMNSTEDTKATLLEILGTDTKKMQQAQKALVKKINEQPENAFYIDLLTWLYTQKDDWEGAMIQMQALDARQREAGQHMIEFARFAMKEHKPEFAIKSYDAVIEKGKELPHYSIARNEKLSILFQQLTDSPSYTQQSVTELSKNYEELLTEFPQFYTTETLQDYAQLEARYNNNPQKAIDLLQKAIALPNISRQQVGLCKLQMGDYMILTGKVWDASLIYSQVDKSFREDVLGEEARFRNAKLSYYQGDFNWADGQLSVLKASTSELIANDALYLSVLITENVTQDSNYTPIRRFAYADLLLFQNKDKEAETLLDSIATAFPEHPLKDDILMKKANLARKHREYEKAISFLAMIHDKHGQDVLGDDAVFKTAEIYEQFLAKPDSAKKYYEMLIVEYPGSTYINNARTKLATLQQGNHIIP